MRANSLAILLFGFTVIEAAMADASAPPKENKGVEPTVLQAVDLGPEIDGMKGRQLRMRTVTIQPGGHIGFHTHKDRPAVLYVLQGVDTIIADGGAQKVLKSGQTSSANKDTAHWHRNDGKEPVVLLLVDVFNTANPAR